MSESLRNSMLALVVSIVMVIVGYKLNDFMSRDRLTVEYVQFKPQTASLPPKAEQANELSRNSQFLQWCGSSPFSDCSYVFGDKLGTTWDAPVIARMKLYLHAFSDHVNQELEQLRQASSTLSQQMKPEDLDGLIALVQPHLAPDAPATISRSATQEDRRRSLAEALNSAMQSDKEAAKLSQQILEYIQSYKAERTGELEIWVTVLNSGDTDGLIRPEASLALNDGTPKQPIKLISANRFSPVMQAQDFPSSAVSIPKRSATTLVFKLIPKILSDPPRSQIINDIKKKSDLQGTLELLDIRNSPVDASKGFPFPPDGSSLDEDTPEN
jgi:hypothetical protein